MTLQDLRYVVALADHGHFGRAAAACDIGQSTLSTQIKKLEKQLGVTLFERTTQSVSVTAVGADIAVRARQVLADVEAIGNVGQQISGPLSGRFSLGVIPTLGPYLLPWLVPALRDSRLVAFCNRSSSSPSGQASVIASKTRPSAPR